jgi:hypothetical protein
MLTTIVVNKREESAMKTISVRIDEQLVNAARTAAASEFRTIQGQIEFWAKVGRAALDNPDLPVEFVVDALQSLSSSREETKPFIPRSAK